MQLRLVKCHVNLVTISHLGLGCDGVKLFNVKVILCPEQKQYDPNYINITIKAKIMFATHRVTLARVRCGASSSPGERKGEDRSSALLRSS